MPITEILNEGWTLIQVRLDSRIRYYHSDEESDDEPKDNKAKVGAPMITLLALML